jgi:RimJ/RimL family protein N-acetyltransferase
MTDTVKSLDWKPALRPSANVLRGRSVVLEPLDAQRHTEPLWMQIEGHDNLWTWLFDGPFRSQEDLGLSLIEKQAATEAVFWAILPTETNKPSGYLSLMRIDAANGVLEVGNILLAPNLQRTTAGTEALYLICSYVFDTLGYRRIEWKCNADNLPSRRAATRLGFRFEAIFRQHMVMKGKNRDTAWFAILDSEWPALKQAFEAWLDPANFDSKGRQQKSLQSFLPSES